MANVEFTTTSEAESTAWTGRSTRRVDWAAAEPARDTSCGLIAGLDVGGVSLTTSGSGGAGKCKSHEDEAEIESHFDWIVGWIIDWIEKNVDMKECGTEI